MGTTGDVKVMEQLNWFHRNNQRIGMAWAYDPNGPWHRSDHPLINVSNHSTADDALMVTTPSVTVMKDGKPIVLYCTVAYGNPMENITKNVHIPLAEY